MSSGDHTALRRVGRRRATSATAAVALAALALLTGCQASGSTPSAQVPAKAAVAVPKIPQATITVSPLAGALAVRPQ